MYVRRFTLVKTCAGGCFDGVVTSIFSVRGYRVKLMTVSLNTSHEDVAQEAVL